MEGGLVKEFDLTGMVLIGFDKDQHVWLFQPQEKKLLTIGPNDTVQNLDLDSLNLPEWVYDQDRFNRVSIDPSGNLLWWYHRKDDLKSLFALDPKKKCHHRPTP